MQALSAWDAPGVSRFDILRSFGNFDQMATDLARVRSKAKRDLPDASERHSRLRRVALGFEPALRELSGDRMCVSRGGAPFDA